MCLNVHPTRPKTSPVVPVYSYYFFGYFCPKYAMKLAAHTFLVVMLTAEFGVHEAALRGTHRKECDGYGSFSKSLGSFKSSNSIEVEVVK